jgi:uncharacterized protein involved in exopolysaccharide biosynthesis
VRRNRAPSDPPDLKDVDRIGPVPESMPSSVGSTDLQSYLEVLAWARSLILAGLAVGACAGYIYAWSRPAVYEAVATLLITRSKIGVDPAQAAAPPALRAYVVNNGVVGQVLRELRLTDRPRSLDPLTFIRDHLQVEELQQTDIIRIKVRLDDARLAAQSANRLVELSTELNRRVNTEESLGVRDFIKSQLDDSHARMQSLANQLVAYKRDAQLELRRTEVQSLLDRRREMADLTVQLEGERASLREAERELAGRPRVLPAMRLPNRVAELGVPWPEQVPATATPSNPTPASPAGSTAGAATVPPVVSSSAPRPTAGSAAPSETRRVPPSPTLERSAQAWLSGASASPIIDPIYEILDYQVSAAKVRVADLEKRQQLLVARFGVAAPTMAELTELYSREMAQANLQSEYDLASQIHSDLYTRYEHARIQVASRSTELKIIDPAISPPASVGPSPVVAAALGGLALAAFVVLYAFVRSYARTLRIP